MPRMLCVSCRVHATQTGQASVHWFLISKRSQSFLMSSGSAMRDLNRRSSRMSVLYALSKSACSNLGIFLSASKISSWGAGSLLSFFAAGRATLLQLPSYQPTKHNTCSLILCQPCLRLLQLFTTVATFQISSS